MRFHNRVAVITGGASGIGEAAARRIVAEGGRVALLDMNAAGMARVAAETGALAVSVDVADEASVARGVAEALAHFGRLDIAIHSAGIVGPTSTPILDYPSEAFERLMRVNLFGGFYLVKHALPPMLAQGYGRLLMISSIAGKEGNPGMIGYSTSKAGLLGLVKAVGKEYASTGVTVNGIAPAVIRTPLNDDTSPEQLRYMAERIPMQRLGTVDEAAALICWICSEEASFNTGAIFDLSGGRATY